MALFGHEFTVQDFFVTPNLLGVQFFKVKEKRLAIVQMIMSNVNYICVKGEDNRWMLIQEIQAFVFIYLGVTVGHELQSNIQIFDILINQVSLFQL